jgi:hypothetical protein
MSYNTQKIKNVLNLNTTHITNSKNQIPPWFSKTIQKPVGESANAIKIKFYALVGTVNTNKKKKSNSLTL